jgi:SAM-dependent methyltransferase
VRLDNPLLVRWEYASEERLAKRNALTRELIDGEHPEDAAFAAVAEVRPARVLDVGCGTGELTRRFVDELGAEVEAIDVSPRMVELTSARGIRTQEGDVEQLPFGDRQFDCVFAGWVLYHAADAPRAIAECARVLKSEGRLVAATVCGDNISELWTFVEDPEPRAPLSFNCENGTDLLRASFGRVEQRDLRASLVFPDAERMRTFVASTIDRAHLAPQVPELAEPFRATTRHAVFVAERPA